MHPDDLDDVTAPVRDTPPVLMLQPQRGPFRAHCPTPAPQYDSEFNYREETVCLRELLIVQEYDRPYDAKQVLFLCPQCQHQRRIDMSACSSWLGYNRYSVARYERSERPA